MHSMVKLYQAFQNTDEQMYLVELIQHKYVLKVIQYQLKRAEMNQIDTVDVQNTLFMYLVTRKNKIQFEHEYQFKSYLSITITGIVLNQIKATQNKPLKTDEYYYDDYTLETIPAPILTYINEQIPAFKEHILEGKTLSELSKKYNTSTSTLSLKFKPLKQEIREYYKRYALI